MASTDLKHMKEDQSRDGQEKISEENKFEASLYGGKDPVLTQVDVPNMTEPRLFGTHMPFPSLPKSVKESNCKIIYICRNPFDIFVSYWTFFNKIRLKKSLTELTLEEAFERYCKGICIFGPFWENMLGYFKESIERPYRVLFLKYEDLKEDVNFNIKRIAEFVGIPFTQEEENNGVIENIIKLCSFESMKESNGNNSGTVTVNVDREFFFRKGEIGDWVNYFSPSMIERLSKIMQEKFSGSSLSFKGCP
ncbi:putative P-loop containing nucleoside triphosphate hydrolase [Medicago truncatula]|uniref:Sulfotransferase n=1 Tax=Medicago truncatula TaxID=3880 RepID=A0A072TNP4_MEDTR|nr:sulfotransferase [Medicago truncatula]RHN40336.1 putative P-loop containing nucleoside triphosphate hydrolase [Medicago truncatula]